MQSGTSRAGSSEPAAFGLLNPSSLRTYLLLGALVIAILAGAFVGSRGRHTTQNSPSGKVVVGQAAPAFTTDDLDGKPVSLADFRGKPVVLNFWATWCTACEAEMPAIQSAVRRHRAQQVSVLAIDYRELDRDGIRSFLAGLRVNFRVALDPDADIASAYGVSFGLPITVFVDREGRIAWIHVGEMQAADIEQGITKALA